MIEESLRYNINKKKRIKMIKDGEDWYRDYK